jgi:transposase
MVKRFKVYDSDQMFLLPPSLREWLPEGHLAYFVSDVVDQLDLREMVEGYKKDDARGQPAYHPAMMTKLLLYGYCVGVASSRKIEKKTYEDVAFRVLAAGYHPDHDTIAAFRKRHLKVVGELFVEVLELCQEAGLVKLGHVALDGTKVKANASKHKAMSYGRMCEKEKELEREVEELLRKAEEVDEEEDRRYGKGKRGDELPEELRFRKSRLKKIREAKEALEREARERAEAEPKAPEETKPSRMKCGPKPKGPPDVPKPTQQRNFTDPESRIMKDTTTKGFVQGYNAQVAVDAKSQVIVAAEVTTQPNDKNQAGPMVEQIEKNLGHNPKELSADCGYYSESNVRRLQDKSIDVFIPPTKTKHTVKELLAPRGRIPHHLSVRDRMIRKLRTKRGKERYKLRKEVAEPVFGQIKEVRGFRAFLLRGRTNVRCEWRLICATHNLLKLFRSGYAVAAA